MRDRATVEVALMAAETGHLVLSTLHTVDAGQSINRILGLFTIGEEQQLRLRLADSIRYIVSQRLAPKVGGGRQLLTEIMGHNLRTREAIALGEAENRSFYEIIEASSPFGWITFDQFDPRCLRSGHDQRRNRRPVRLEKGTHHARDRSYQENARDRQPGRHRLAARSARRRQSLSKKMNTEQDSNSFDLGDKTALVCVDHPEYQKLIMPQLVDLGYKMHLGLFEDDVLLKLATYSYDVVVVYENFKGSTRRRKSDPARDGAKSRSAAAGTLRRPSHRPVRRTTR